MLGQPFAALFYVCLFSVRQKFWEGPARNWPLFWRMEAFQYSDPYRMHSNKFSVSASIRTRQVLSRVFPVQALLIVFHTWHLCCLVSISLGSDRNFILCFVVVVQSITSPIRETKMEKTIPTAIGLRSGFPLLINVSFLSFAFSCPPLGVS